MTHILMSRMSLATARIIRLMNTSRSFCLFVSLVMSESFFMIGLCPKSMLKTVTAENQLVSKGRLLTTLRIPKGFSVSEIRGVK